MKQARARQDAAAKDLGLSVEATNSVGMKLRLIPAGNFTMGSAPEEIDRCLAGPKEGWEDGPLRSEGPAHVVEITRPFYFGETDVTVGQFRQFVKEKNYSVVDNRWLNPGWEQTDNHPVVFVTWNNVVDFCDWLSAKEGKKYRLPTEAEWEYACRAGTDTRYSFGDDEGDLLKHAWIGNNAQGRSQPVKELEANAWGLFDMHGNVWQWCHDWYGEDYYAQSPKQDPQGPESGKIRVLRGGGCNKGPLHCRSAFRNRAASAPLDARLGFRVVLVVAPK
jgi:formylglycine-generating enzyme required for sulfatase activity